MPALSGQRDPAASGGYQTGDPESRPRPEHADRRASHCGSPTDHQPILRCETRKRQCKGREIVDHLKPVKSESGFQCQNRKAPGVVGHRDAVAGNRRSNRDRALARHRQGATLRQKGGYRVMYRRIILVRQGARKQQRSIRRNQAEAGVRRADVADEPCRGRSHRRTSLADRAPTKLSRHAVMSLRSITFIIAVQRSLRSPSGMLSPCRMASAMPSMSNGLTITASPSSRAAPAKQDSTRTPGSPAGCDATYSLATRFMPSRNGVTSAIRLARTNPVKIWWLK